MSGIYALECFVYLARRSVWHEDTSIALCMTNDDVSCPTVQCFKMFQLPIVSSLQKFSV